MKQILLFVCVLISGWLVVGCDSKEQQDKEAMEQLLDNTKDLAGESNENMMALTESPGAMSNNAERLAEMESSVTKAAGESSETQSEELLTQAKILKELQALVGAFEKARNSFASEGGLNVSKIAGQEEILDRVQLIDEMGIALKRLDERAPVLLAGLGKNSASELKKMEIMQELRSCDFEKMPLMKQYLLILYDNWESITVTAENKIFFGDTPTTVVENFNNCGRSIHAVDVRQSELSKSFVALDQP